MASAPCAGLASAARAIRNMAGRDMAGFGVVAAFTRAAIDLVESDTDSGVRLVGNSKGAAQDLLDER